MPQINLIGGETATVQSFEANKNVSCKMKRAKKVSRPEKIEIMIEDKPLTPLQSLYLEELLVSEIPE